MNYGPKCIIVQWASAVLYIWQKYGKYILHENRMFFSKKRVISGIVALKLLFSNMAIVAEYWKENSVQNAEEEFSYWLRNPINSRIPFIIGTPDEDIAFHISDLSCGLHIQIHIYIHATHVNFYARSRNMLTIIVDVLTMYIPRILVLRVTNISVD